MDKTEVDAISYQNTFERWAEKTGISRTSATVKILPCLKAGRCFYLIFMSQSMYWRVTHCPSVPYPSENMHLHLGPKQFNIKMQKAVQQGTYNKHSVHLSICTFSD